MNRIRAMRCRASRPLTTKSRSIKGTDCKSGGWTSDYSINCFMSDLGDKAVSLSDWMTHSMDAQDSAKS